MVVVDGGYPHSPIASFTAKTGSSSSFIASKKFVLCLHYLGCFQLTYACDFFHNLIPEWMSEKI